ncbi:NUDIX domain-containing protein [Fulvivirga lutea]|uniref:NUDIX hydrolase n=1 Tax=Fulvivirga lutea TaxID=2810512 RepID=A0A974WMN0_9BACT|nr:NUDIX hydrolase [Fulvivirga lutea]QSE99080.1 NUDIX hydrolase [Fulvivirga lutea]
MDVVNKTYGDKVRIRVCGICVQNDSILLVNHKGLNSENEFWSPPGGGMIFGENAEKTLNREIKEETGLTCRVKEFLFVNEYYKNPLHAIELFFAIDLNDFEPKIGFDPEHDQNEQIIQDVRFVTFKELSELPISKKHTILHKNLSENKLLNLRGYFKLWQ